MMGGLSVFLGGTDDITWALMPLGNAICSSFILISGELRNKADANALVRGQLRKTKRRKKSDRRKRQVVVILMKTVVVATS
jgi:hypothetical protein